MDIRKFQDCRFFLQGRCTLGVNCSFVHDEAKAAAIRAARQASGGGPAARPPPATQDCYFFSVGQCRKGDACPFRHDPSKVVQQPAASQPASIEEKLSRPLGASIPAAGIPQRSLADENLILQLDASPVGRATAPGRSHPAAGRGPQHGAAAAASGRGGNSGIGLGRGRGAISGSMGGEGPREWGPARPGWGAAAQPAAISAPQRGGRISSAGREPDMREARQQDRRSNGVVANSIEAASPPKRRSVLDRLGPRLGEPSDSDAPGSSSRRPAARATISEQEERPAKRLSSRAEPLSLDEAPTKRSRAGEAAAHRQQPDRGTARDERPAVCTRDGALSGRGAALKLLASARLGQRAADSSASDASAPKRPSLSDVAQLEGGSGPARGGVKAPADASKAAVFAPPKSREELRKERERAALAKPLPTAQPSAASAPAEPSKPSAPAPAAAAPSQPARKRAPIPAPGQQAAAAQPAAPAAAAKPAAASRPAPARAKAAAPAAKPAAAAKGAKPSTPRTAKPGVGPTAGSTEFNWNVEGIEDAEDDFENDLDLDADVDADAALEDASKAADFDQELAEFENAFD